MENVRTRAWLATRLTGSARGLASAAKPVYATWLGVGLLPMPDVDGAVGGGEYGIDGYGD